MKKGLLITTLYFLGLHTHAQEVIVGGSMDDEEARTSNWCTDAADAGYITFDYKDDIPADGEGGCLEVYGYGTSGIFVFQEVTITPGSNYTFDGVIKNISAEPLTSTC
jgi:hypothetical protein